MKIKIFFLSYFEQWLASGNDFTPQYLYYLQNCFNYFRMRMKKRGKKERKEMEDEQNEERK